jgi:type VI secretion system protein ImpH
MERLVRDGLLTRADLDLGFPPSDLVEVERIADRLSGSTLPSEEKPLEAMGDATGLGGAPFEKGPGEPIPLQNHPLYRFTVTFMGLYGSASPLPPFYAQEVLEDYQGDNPGTRDIFDLISYSSYRNHSLAHFARLLPMRILEDGDTRFLTILSSLLGLNLSTPKEGGFSDEGVHNIGIFATKIRHPQGLLLYLTGMLRIEGMVLEECVPRWVPISPEQRLVLGNQGHNLGVDAILGESVLDLAGMYRLTLPVDSLELLEDLMPGGHKRNLLEKSLSNYLNTPLEHDLKLQVDPQWILGVELGEPKGRLGISAFLGVPPGPMLLSAVPPLG